MSFIPYSRQAITEEDIEEVASVLRSDFLTQGEVTPAFENAFAKAHEVPHAVAVANGTAALHIACLAMGIAPGTRVWTSPNSFVASANCALYCGAMVDFVDIDPETRNMSVQLLEEKLRVAQREGKLPKLLIPVDFGGLPCDLREIRSLADRYGFQILQDASHATGAKYLGAPVGSAYAHASVFSFHAVKIITTAEGGIVTTQDGALAHRLKLLRSHGTTRESAYLEQRNEGAWYYEQHLLGFNYRLTEVQAALGLSQLRRLPHLQSRRRALADRYDAMLGDLPLKLPARRADRESSWHLYVIEVEDAAPASRRELFEKLRAAEIGANVHYIPIHTQPYYRRLGFKKGFFPNSERYYERALTIPLYPEMAMSQQERVVGVLKTALR